MKLLLSLTALILFSSAALAHPGSSILVCKSATNSGASQKIELLLKRMNGVGWAPPIIELKINNQKYVFSTPSEESNYGNTFHNSPLHVITATADVPFSDNPKEVDVSGQLSVIAMPETVKAYDFENKPVSWSLEAEKDECYDTNGSATFQGVIKGYLSPNQTDYINVETQVLDCELSYNSGMAC